MIMRIRRMRNFLAHRVTLFVLMREERVWSDAEEWLRIQVGDMEDDDPQRRKYRNAHDAARIRLLELASEIDALTKAA